MDMKAAEILESEISPGPCCAKPSCGCRYCRVKRYEIFDMGTHILPYAQHLFVGRAHLKDVGPARAVSARLMPGNMPVPVTSDRLGIIHTEMLAVVSSHGSTISSSPLMACRAVHRQVLFCW